MTIWTKAFWLATGERVLATFLASVLGFLTFDGFAITDADWSNILSVSGTVAGITLIKCLLANLSTRNGPGFTDAEQVVPPEPQPKAKNQDPLPEV
jgi:hypothetical protein